MNIVFIGYSDNRIYSWLMSCGYSVNYLPGNEKVSLSKLRLFNPQLIVLHGCHTILGKEIIEEFPNKIINCHGGYLPFNRGAHPNIWSIVDRTPAGVTVHLINEEIDKGKLIARKRLYFSHTDTIGSSYWKTRIELEDLFIESWEKIVNFDNYSDFSVLEKGTIHFRKDLMKIGISDISEIVEMKIIDFEEQFLSNK